MEKTLCSKCGRESCPLLSEVITGLGTSMRAVYDCLAARPAKKSKAA